MGKNPNGAGSYRRLPSGTWLGQIMDGFTPDGKKNIVNFTAPTKAEVQDKIRRYKTEKEDGTLIRKSMSFSDWADLWYKDYKGQVQPSTYSGYKYTLNLLKKSFGPRPLRDIKQMDINSFLSSLHAQGLSHSLETKCKAMLIQIFNAAEANDLVLKNPALHAKCSKDLQMQADENKKDAFTDEEFDLLMKELPQDLLGNSIRTMLVSGLRSQELLALRPDDIEPDGSVIHVTKAVKMVDGKAVLGPPKSKRSRRDIPIPKSYQAYVQSIREAGGKAFIWTSVRKENLLFAVGSFRRQYDKALDAIPGVRHLPPHCCRHTYITRLQAKGVPLEFIARLAGHSDIKTTDGYAHTSIDTLSNIVAVLDGSEEEKTKSAKGASV